MMIELSNNELLKIQKAQANNCFWNLSFNCSGACFILYWVWWNGLCFTAGLLKLEGSKVEMFKHVSQEQKLILSWFGRNSRATSLLRPSSNAIRVGKWRV